MSQAKPYEHGMRPLFVLLGVAAAVIVWFLLRAAPELSPQARTVASLGVLMAVWWMTEALPIEATGLVPLALFPLLRATTIEAAAAPYANKIIFLFLGGMLLGCAMERWNLHRRFALNVVRALGSGPSRLVAAFLLATAFVSMWISNTAATIVMLPIAASVAGWVSDHVTGDDAPHRLCRQRLGPALVLAVAFGASIGGVGTVIGTPPIGQYQAYANTLVSQGRGSPVSFRSWLNLGLPVLAVVLPFTWFILAKVIFPIPLRTIPGVRATITDELKSLGPMSPGERWTLCVFAAAATAWVLNPRSEQFDTPIAIIAALALFLIPVKEAGLRRPLLTWPEAEKAPWGILILFGGGLSLADSIRETGVDRFIASGADGLSGMPLLPLLWIIGLVTIILTEFTSNTALVAAGLPVAEAIALKLGISPAPILVTMTLTASLGFMLPAGTAPNALVFASGRVTMREMMKAGFWLDVGCAFSVPLLVITAMKLGILPGQK
ncbi:MAG: SLC13/DASS family transporter [Planctomycetes bacterium]|nr:SLC13/DASS family transporter [Planctomycetota bacterium]